MMNKVKNSALLIAFALVAGFGAYQWWQRGVAEDRVAKANAAALAREAGLAGAATSTRVSEREARELADEQIGGGLEGLASVAAIESVATASSETVESFEGYSEAQAGRMTIRDEHGRINITQRTEGDFELTAPPLISFHQIFEYTIVRFKNNGDALLIDVRELSPADRSTLSQRRVTPDSFVVVPPDRKRFRDRFGWSATCGIATTFDREQYADVYCGVGWGFQF